ncbi:Hypothetical predicted protein [Paramuricea clavata]|uniref:Uncharacterized protein n=1 Tax=Paramuricea clavata TaxID=317549 RepID=A0A6S7GXW3_PARCT|nr:Hypothetical predicted protein [Paramuricea clavata]
MSLKIVVLMLVAGIAMAKVDEYGNDYETPEKKESANDEKPKMVMEDMNTETSTALVQNDAHDPDSIKNKGLCHWGIAVWFKPGFSIRCSCMKCTCKSGGNWACAYEFAYCPYFYCGNQIYNPSTQICCCGKVHSKKSRYSCCGYFYYDTRVSQCCNYYSVKPRKAKCPRYRV